jgi:hypothetical protein
MANSKLLANWGELAETLECNAEMRVYDPLSDFCVYVFAQNPDDLDEIYCIIAGFDVEVTLWSVDELQACYNSDGQKLKTDHSFKPTHAGKLLRKLQEGQTRWTKLT